MCLKNDVMIINLTISQWSARKYDKTVSHEIEVQHNATDAGRFNKILIADETLKQISKIAGSARTYHYEHTLPWGDNGDRILTAKIFMDYVTEMGKFKSEFERRVAEFIAQYPVLRTEAEKRLATMFNYNDYPNEKNIEARFGMRFSFMPISDETDLRVNISADELEKIKVDIQSSVTSRIDIAQKDLIEKLKEAVSNMAKTLTDNTKIFRDSLVGNIATLVDIAPMLNFNKNQHITDVVEMMKPLCVDPANLRLDAAFRKEIADKAILVLNFI